ncbi:MAG: TetR/AcrR family transcriptional regulator [Gammaproteobacteria bacterium]|nr:TetR/AcrR family transcriptional regulator [Gammaproteobacteria bacterium]MCP5135504.1 TetR/AcrR family transcriptional regulator [Gammaproteobacteria bacterium]
MNAVSTDTRQRILESARDLIYASSYAEVGVAAICERASVKKGSFYHFFPSKQELTLAVIDEFLVEFKERMFAQAFSPDIAPLDRFRKLLEIGYGFQVEMAAVLGHIPGCPFGNLAAELSTQDDGIRSKVDQVFALMERQFAATLHEAIGRGDVPPEVDADATARAMLAFLEGVLLMAKTRNDARVMLELGPAVADLRILKSSALST